MMNRRNFLNTAAIATTSSLLFRAENSLGSLLAEDQYSLPSLPYTHDAFDAIIDTQTMQIHHGKHHAAYVANLNKAAVGLQLPKSPAELMSRIHTLPDEKKNVIRNNGGGHYNHSLFWNIMGANKGGQPTGKLMDAINNELGGWDKFIEDFNKFGEQDDLLFWLSLLYLILGSLTASYLEMISNLLF